MQDFFRHLKAQHGFTGELDVPWFVSRGYLVLKPDIQYKVGEPGQSAPKAVEGAANFMTKRPYVDKHRIGIQGHSFGGYETNYIVTHSNIISYRKIRKQIATSTLFLYINW